jgi:Flp pilus assembly pilin Flp
VAKFLKAFWNNEAGFIVSSEMLFLYTITVLGIIAGMTNVQRAVITEFTDIGNSLLALDQSYNTFGTLDASADSATGAATNGSGFLDVTIIDAPNSVAWTLSPSGIATADQGGLTSGNNTLGDGTP